MGGRPAACGRTRPGRWWRWRRSLQPGRSRRLGSEASRSPTWPGATTVTPRRSWTRSRLRSRAFGSSTAVASRALPYRYRARSSGTRLVQAATSVGRTWSWPSPTGRSIRDPAGRQQRRDLFSDRRADPRGRGGQRPSLNLFMDSGVGGVLIEGGQVVAGAHGMAGEFGHMPFGARRTRCRCGARGCWNTELDGAALAAGLALPVPADEVSFSRAILTAARNGRRDELRVVGRAAGALGRGLAGLVNATDPELVVLGGLASEMLLAAPARIERTYRDGLMSTIAARPPALVGGTLGDRHRCWARWRRRSSPCWPDRLPRVLRPAGRVARKSDRAPRLATSCGGFCSRHATNQPTLGSRSLPRPVFRGSAPGRARMSPDELRRARVRPSQAELSPQPAETVRPGGPAGAWNRIHRMGAERSERRPAGAAGTGPAWARARSDRIPA